MALAKRLAFFLVSFITSVFIVFVLSWIVVSKASAQTEYWSWYSTLNSQITTNRILKIASDIDGSIWISTFEYDVMHFDGSSWTNFDSSNSPLPDGRVEAIAVEASGVKWFGIGGFGQEAKGVTRFDGTNWTTFNVANSGLPHDNVLAAAIDENNVKWFGTNGGGIARYDGTNWTVYNTTSSGLPDNVIRSILIDSDNSVWIGTNSSGVAHFDGLNWTVYNTSNSSLPHNSVASSGVDIDGSKWFGFGGAVGVARFDGTTWQVFNSSNSCLVSGTGSIINAIAIDTAGTKWLGAQGGGARLTSSSCTRFADDFTIPAAGDVYGVAVDTSGTVWFGGYSNNIALRSFGPIAPPANQAPIANAGGPYYIQEGDSVIISASGIDPEGGRPLTYSWDLDNDGVFEASGQNLSFPRSLPNDNVLSSEVDSNGVMWFGTNGGGVARFDGISWLTYNTENSDLPHDVVRSIAVDTDGSLWFATNGAGVARFDGTNWTNYNTSNSGLLKNSVGVVVVDKLGVKWFGYGGSYGLTSFDGTNWQSYNSFNSCILSTASVNAIAVSSNNDKWIGGAGTALRFDGSNCTNFDDDSSVPDAAEVQAVAVDTSGTVWFGGSSNNVALRSFDGTSWQIFNTSNSNIPSNTIRSIEVDIDGSIWISTFQYGVANFNGTTWISYNSSNTPLPDTRTESITVDSTGVKWFALGGFGQPPGGVVAFDNTNWTPYNSQTTVLLPGGPASYTIHSRVSDNGGILTSDRTPLSGTDTTQIIVQGLPTPTPTLTPTPTPVPNLPPDVGIIVAPSDPILVNSEMSVSVPFTDANMQDTHTAIWNWGDNSSSIGLVNESNGTGTVTGDHVYYTTGVYEIVVAITDNYETSDTSNYQFVVVYDNSSGASFITGSGSINSPAGAYIADLNLTGIARFGFVSKYQPGASMPSGETRFRFQAADNLSFESTYYQWLVVSGPNAKFKGEGTINGLGDYGFLLSATDGVINGGGGTDKFRIKIWDQSYDDIIVYDNQLGASESDNPITELNNGNIVIHN